MAIKTGTQAADTLFGGGPDTLDGGRGDDTYVVYSQQDVVLESDADFSYFDRDTVYAYSSYTLGRDTAVETLSTGLHAATDPYYLVGNRFTRLIIGNYGDNVLDPASNYYERSASNVTLMGLQGNDIYRVYGGGSFNSEIIVEARGEGTDTAYASGSFTLNAGAEVELLIAADQASATSPVTLVGNEFAQAIAGSYGNDNLQGLGGADTLIGLRGDDFYGADGNDLIVEVAGEGNDTLSIQAQDGYVLANGLSIEDLRVSFGFDNASGYIVGNAFSQSIRGNDGANVLDGAGGADTLIGRGGNDVYRVYGTADVVREDAGQGFDTIYTSATYRLSDTAEVELLSTAVQAGTEAIDLFGNGFSQTLAGNFGRNVLDGAGGGDTLIGLGGDDMYRVATIRDQVIEAVGGGNDLVYTSGTFALQAGSEVEALSTLSNAATDAINLTGNEFAQTIVGNFGANRIDGGAGADTLFGLAGDDIFSFSSPLGSGNIDVLADYGNGNDVIALDPAIFAGLPVGDVAAGAIVVGTAAADADDRIIYNAQTGAMFYDADGNGGGAAIQFATAPIGLAATALRFRAQGLLAATVSAPQVAEGGATGNMLDFVVTLDRPAPSGLVLEYATTDGTAISTGIPQRGQDFTAVSGLITVPVGETNIVIRVPIIGDNALEANETLTLRVSGSGLAAPVTSTGTILNDDSTAYINDGGSYSIGGATHGIALETAFPTATAFVIGAATPAVNGLRHDIAFGPNSYGPNALPITFSPSGGPAVGTFDFSDLGKGLVVRPGQDFRNADGELVASIPVGDQQYLSEPDEIIGTPFADVIDRSDARWMVTSPFFGTIRGGAGNDTLIGALAQDGGEGDDLLVGILGTVMTGGAGADTFRLPSLTPRPLSISQTLPNIVTDLNVAEDRIELVLNRTSDLQAGALDASRFHVGSAATTPDQRIIYNPETGDLFFDVNGSLGDMSGARTLFAQLPTHLDLSASNFTLVMP
jgi:Ca2+-binding RTX toxin-like protein